MNTITLTIELGPESQAKLGKILEALQHSRPDCESCVRGVTRYVGAALGQPKQEEAETPAPTENTTQNETPTEAATEPQEAPQAKAVETPAPEAEAPAAEPAPAVTVTLDQIRQKVTYLMAAGGKKKEGARDIVKSYAANISGLPEDKWPEIWDKLTALEG